MAQFGKGDVVRLKSGSPKMTISKNKYGETPAMYICTWFDGIKDKEHLYPEEALELAI